MKKLIVITLFTLLTASSVYADRWCQWSGTEGENCLNDSGGIVRIIGKFPAHTVSIINGYGYYRVTITQPSIGADQLKDAEIWDKVDNQISLTWSIRDMTATEIDERDAGAMDITDYYLWKALLNAAHDHGGASSTAVTNQQAANNLPSDMIDAYQARKRLLGD